jgi:hypothetical protein
MSGAFVEKQGIDTTHAISHTPLYDLCIENNILA